MPQLIRPPGQSQEVATMIDVIGSRARTEILHLLSTKGPLTVAELTEELRADRSATYRHLLKLEQHHYVAGDPGPSDRDTSRSVLWAPIQEQIEKAAAVWRDYATGRSEASD